MSFNDSIKKYNLKNKATSNIKIQHVLSSLSLDDVGIYLQGGPFLADIGLLNYNHKKVLIEFIIKTKIILIHMVVVLLKNYPSLL